MGAQIAVSLAKMKATIPRRIGPPGNEFGMQHEKVFQSVCDRQVRKGEAAPPLRITSHAPIAVIGAIATDYIARPSAGYRLLPCTSTPGQLSKSVGGVAHNIAAAIRAIGLQSCLVRSALPSIVILRPLCCSYLLSFFTSSITFLEWNQP